MATRIVCPSGLTGDIRALKVKEADGLANQAAAKQGTSFEQVFKGCWLETADPGVYSLVGGRLDWGRVLVCDRFYTLLRIRAATFGEDFEFFIPKCGGCGEKYGWELRLCDLPTKPLPESSRAAFTAGNKFTAALSDGRAVTFHLQTGVHEIQAGATRNRALQKLTAALMSRVDAIEGVESKDKLKAISDLDLGEARDLVAQFDEVDGGVETDIITHCSFCGSENEVSLPLDRGFWMPEKTKAST